MTTTTDPGAGARVTDAALRSPLRALPFWISLTLVPVIVLAAALGGWWVLIVPAYSWGVYSFLDAVGGLETANPDPGADRAALGWYRAITLVWPLVQGATLFGVIAYATRAPHLGGWELAGLALGLGVMTGTIGINYAHELMHQRSRLERRLSDWLLAMVLYGHFRSEHLLVHHRHVATPRDPATARFDEGFNRFFPRVLRQSLASALRAEAAMLARRGLPATHWSNPFWGDLARQGAMLGAAVLVGGWAGAAMFVLQASVAIWQLELVNYVEHYGLERRETAPGRYEPVRPHHSWNAAHRASNWLLINLQRHSDHHFKPDRPFPLLQTYAADEAPQLPSGYAAMTILAMAPPLWRRVMNPRVLDWRRRHYPHVLDWGAKGSA